MYDPLTGSTRPMELTVLEERIRTFPDSVTAEDGRWQVAREDTVTAWRVEHDISGIPLEAWVDEDGRLLEANAVGGFRLVRTAFEFAYFGEYVPTSIDDPSYDRPSGLPEDDGGDGRDDGAGGAGRSGGEDDPPEDAGEGPRVGEGAPDTEGPAR